jgi:bifunctional non-homologous end joining protein LigD
LKLKVEFRQEFVVGGFTEPRNSRQHMGALLLGYFDHGRLIYVGHTGGGFTGSGLAEMYRRLKPLERKTSPFAEVPRTNEKAHWVEPRVVVEVKFSEWTADGKLRQPIYLGMRDDKDPQEVGREKQSVQKKEPAKTRLAAKSGSTSRARKRVYAERRLLSSTRLAAAGRERGAGAPRASDLARLIDSLQQIEDDSGSGTIELQGRDLTVTNLNKVFFPRKKLTKGDLMRYYLSVAPLVLPVMKDRPLVLKRFPNGVGGQSFFQQNAGEPPEGVRVEKIETEGSSTNLRIVGGSLYTLLYTVQLGSISVDPWHSRIQSLDFADYAIIDLDPGPRATFGRVIQVALLVKETLDRLGLHAALKTSGSTGIHIYLPLPPKTPNEAATLVAQIVATEVAKANPKVATIQRFVKTRAATAVYVDFLQNIIGKTVAAAFSARANADALVSTPLQWEEVTDDLDPRDFTIETAPARFAAAGDIWATALKKPNSLKGLS